MDKPDIYSRTDLLGFLKDQIAFLFSKNRRLSYRSISSKAGFASPNYLQRILGGEKRLTQSSAKKLASALSLSTMEQEYFAELLALDRATKTSDKIHILEKLKTLASKKQRRTVEDENIYTHWLNLTIIELAQIKNLELTVDGIFQLLCGRANKQEISQALDFLLQHKYLTPTSIPHVYECNPIDFQRIDDGRSRFSVLQNHLRYLDIAKQRIHDPKSDRCFQALTIAVPREKMELVRRRIKEVIDNLNAELSGDPSADSVLQLQCQAFFLAKRDLPIKGG